MSGRTRTLRHRVQKEMVQPQTKATRVGAVVSAILLLFTATVTWSRPDWAAAFTLLPPVTWVVLGLLLALASWRARRWLWLVSVGWVVFAAFAVEPIRSGLRPGFLISGEQRAPGTNLRVVSLNCAGGLPEAAMEVAAFRPDVVLLQESPSRPEIEKIAVELFGSRAQFVSGPDASIVSSLPMQARRLARHVSNMVAADAGSGLRVVSLRLAPPLGRVDMWNPECWTEQTKNLQARRAEVREVLARSLEDKPRVLLMGGDFNAVAGDASLSPLANLRDSFDEAGRGLCDTAVNDYPFARIDRLYVMGSMDVLSSCVFKTKNSDHRLLVVDLKMPSSHSTP